MDLVVIKLKTAFALGIVNIFRVLLYRAGIKTGFHRVCHLNEPVPSGPYFSYPKLKTPPEKSIDRWTSAGILFGNISIPLNDSPPNWLQNPLTREKDVGPLKAWWLISDFDSPYGDIKLVWELSRMDWSLAFAQRSLNGDEASLDQLNLWVGDWALKNPPYLGPNWKCGQEAAIRVLHLACCTKILGQQKSILPGLQSLLSCHLSRISATLSYAISQNNNHGTSEAAALYVGGSILVASGCSQGLKWQKKGRYWLENRVKNLIEHDGSFSQYSLNYHRMVLDTLSFVEIWRRDFSLEPFSKDIYKRLSSATNWLFQMVSKENGDGPNVGQNDGAHLFQLTDSTYRDFRPSVHLAMNLFNNQLAYTDQGLWNTLLDWLEIEESSSAPPNYEQVSFSDGGYIISRVNNAMAMFRYPNFKYRPSQSDALHLDLWIAGDNVFPDAGSYSYNSNPDLSWYFSGTAGHNTVQFDDRDQMPKLSRFLFGGWLKTDFVSSIFHEKDAICMSASYSDFKKAKHHREIKLSEKSLKVVDEVSGFNTKAILRWRLNVDLCEVRKEKGSILLTNGENMLAIKSDVPITRAEVVKGWKSLFYMQKTEIDVLEVEISSSGRFITEFRW